MPPDLERQFNFAGSADECAEHLRRQTALGVDIHMVSLAASARTNAANALRTLATA
jgi:hypothetical protein